MLTFDADELTKRLGLLDGPLRCAFAAACSERLLHSVEDYQQRMSAYFGYSKPYRDSLNFIWNALAENNVDAFAIHDQIRLVEHAIPKEGNRAEGGQSRECWNELFCYAEHAGIALRHSLKCLCYSKAKYAADVAGVVLEAIDQKLMDSSEAGHVTSEIELEILSNTMMQTEIGRQERDLGDLLNQTDERKLLEILQLLRTRAHKELSLQL